MPNSWRDSGGGVANHCMEMRYSDPPGSAGRRWLRCARLDCGHQGCQARIWVQFLSLSDAKRLARIRMLKRSDNNNDVRWRANQS